MIVMIYANEGGNATSDYCEQSRVSLDFSVAYAESLRAANEIAVQDARLRVFA